MFVDPFDIRRDVASQNMSREQKLRKVAEQFESLFVSQLLKEMRDTVPLSDLMGENKFANKMFQEMWDGEISKTISQGNGIGLSDVIYEQMAKVYLNPPPGARPQSDGTGAAAAGLPAAQPQRGGIAQVLGRLQELEAQGAAQAAAQAPMPPSAVEGGGGR